MYGGWFGGGSSVMRGESSDYGKMPRFKGYRCDRTKVLSAYVIWFWGSVGRKVAGICIEKVDKNSRR